MVLHHLASLPRASVPQPGQHCEAQGGQEGFPVSMSSKVRQLACLPVFRLER